MHPVQTAEKLAERIKNALTNRRWRYKFAGEIERAELESEAEKIKRVFGL